MIRGLDGKTPKIAESAFISEAAYVVGDVEIDERSNVWPGAVIRGDRGRITIGKYTNIEDNCVIHSGSVTSSDGNVVIGDHVILGHGAVLNCRRIGNNVLIGMNATILHDTEIGNFCIIAAGCVVEPDRQIPDHSFVAGVPGKILGEPAQKNVWWIKDGSKDYVLLAETYKKEGL